MLRRSLRVLSEKGATSTIRTFRIGGIGTSTSFTRTSRWGGRASEDSTTLTGSLQVQDADALGQILHEGDLADNATPHFQSILPAASSGLPALPAPQSAGTDGGEPVAKAKAKAKGKRTAKAKAKKNAETEGADENGMPETVAVTAPIEKAKSARRAILKEGEEARSLAISIEGLECSGDVITTLQKHAANMTELYKEINAKILAGDNDENCYEKIYETQEGLNTWFKARKKIAKSMKAAAEAGTK